MTINKNLTESSLGALLTASGWDKQDIEEGLNIFNYYSGKHPIRVEPTKPVQKVETAPILSSESENNQNIEAELKIEKENNINQGDYTLSEDFHINVDDIINNDIAQVTQEDKNKIEEAKILEDDNNKKTEITAQSVPPESISQTVIEDNSAPSSNYDTLSIFLIILNSIIGILFLLFILYIILI